MTHCLPAPVNIPTAARSASVWLRRGLTGSLLGSVLLVSCANTSYTSKSSGEMAVSSAPQAVEESNIAADLLIAESTRIPGLPPGESPIEPPVEPPAQSPSQAKPQLIKRAELSLEVEDVAAAIQAISQLITQEQGDILNLNENRSDYQRRSANLTLRIPQQRLDPALEKLAALGKVESRNISAEDVSGQLVDTDARLRNSRKQEDMLLKIMEQSGEMQDVLAVSQELARVRESIEQIDAQLKRLKSQVAYSTIELYLTEPVTFTSPTRTKFSAELKNTWDESTDSVLSFSRGLVQLGLVLLVWSPYLGVLALLIWGAKRAWQRRGDRSAPAPETTPST